MTTAGRIRPVPIEEEVRSSYLDYAMSVIVARALPDVRDGLKPVQRRILYAMHDLNLGPNTSHRKCARIVGEVLGKYHPHGDAPVYEALVRLAQPFSLRAPLVDGQGNFGSVDGDPPAAMRYTEARLTPVAQETLADIELDTVDFTPNFDDSVREPMVLPARLPNLLVNGASGIAVGMATNIPPHNLGEVCNTITYLIDHPEATVEELMAMVPGPDFPTGAVIRGRQGIQDAYETGRGRVVVEARAEIEELRGNRTQIAITELPYQVNKAALVEKIAQLARDRKIEGISDIRDESDRHGMRVVVELRRDAQPQVVLNNLYTHTPLRSTFHILMLALVNGQPQELGLKRILQLYIAFRQQVVTRRSEHLLKKARERAHLLEGLRTAISQLDLVVSIIRNATDVEAARNGLMEQLSIDEVQAQAILEMQLRRLAALERQKLEDEYQGLLKTIGGLQALLASPTKMMALIKEETQKLHQRYATPRRSELSEEEVRISTREELIPRQAVVVTISHRGYVKRIPYNAYRLQRRGGKGVRGMSTREGDDVKHLVVTDTHALVLFFTSKGRVYQLRCFDIPGDLSRTTRGMSLVNLIPPLAGGEQVSTVLAIPTLDSDQILVLATRGGVIKATPLRRFTNIRSAGLIATRLRSGDKLVSARLASPEDDILMVSERGQAIRFPVEAVRRRSRAAGGIRGIRLAPGDRVMAMEVAQPDAHLLVVSQHGYGKLTPISRYPRHNRGGLGVRTFKVTTKTGPIAAAQVVSDPEGKDLTLVSARGVMLRVSMDEVKKMGRSTQGVIIWRDKEPQDEVASIAWFEDGMRQRPPSGRAQGHPAKPAQRNGTEPEADELEDDEEAEE
ncbi:MAG: DNA gyrase subunit A [Dehalococcoidia bacterium]